MYRRARTGGFTLLEVLIVVAIIGLLASIVLVSLNGGRQKARDSERLQHLRQIGHLLEIFKLDHGRYPISVEWASACSGGAEDNWIPDGTDYEWHEPYVPFIPRDPSQDCTASPLQAYQYKSDGQQYQLTTKLENPSPTGEGNMPGRSYDGLTFTPYSLSPSPIIVTFSSVTSPTNQSPIPFTVSFSRAVSGLVSSAFSVVTGFITNLVALSSTAYQFFVSPTDNGTVTVSIGTGAVDDGSGGTNAPAQISVVYDALRPHISLFPDPLPATVSGAFSVSLNSTVALVDISATSISVTNGTVSNFSATSQNGRDYSFTITPLGPGEIAIEVLNGAVHSAAGNSNVESNILTTTAL